MKKVKGNILIIDGYNIINGWENLSKTAKKDLNEARAELDEVIEEYAYHNSIESYIVYDAYNVKTLKKDRVIKKSRYLTIIFTEEGQTADAYIEKFLHDYKYKRNTTIRVATNDYDEQNMILGKGAVRLTARELYLEIQATKKDIKKVMKENQNMSYTVEQWLDEETYKILEKIRRG